MARVPKNWERRLVELAAIHGVTDFLARGRLTKAESKVFYTILNKLGRPGARAAGSTAARLGGTALGLATRGLGAAKYVALRHPVFTAGALTLYAYKNREELGDLARQGYEIVEDVGQQTRAGIQEAVERRREDPDYLDLFGLPVGPIAGRGFPEFLKPKRKKSKYNKAVSAAMKAVKASTKGGKRGKISKPKTVFKTVSKAVSRVNKGLKASTKGITGIAARAARKVIGKKKKAKKGKATFTYRKN